MKRFAVLSLGALVSFALVAGTYAGQGQSGAGGSSGQPGSGTPPMKSESPAQPAPGPIISPKTAGHTETIEGELLRIDGGIYVVKDLAGKEVSLLVDNDTKIDGNIAAHDKVVATATAMKKQHKETGKWHADSIKKK
jgi:nucleoid-associated protein YgaU